MGGRGPSRAEVYARAQRQAQIQAAKRQRQIQLQHHKALRQQRIHQEQQRQASLIQLRERQRRQRENQRRIDKKNAILAQQVKQAQEKAKENIKRRARLYDKCHTTNQNDFLNHVNKMKRPPKTKKFSVAFLGPTCAGKTTLINTLVERIVSRPSPLRNTTGITKVFENNHIQLFDVFGTNDVETYHNFQILKSLMEVHLVICLYVDSVESTTNLAKLLSAASCKVHFTLNKIDLYEKVDRKIIEANDRNVLMKFCPGCTNGQTSSKKMIGIEHLKWKLCKR